MLEFTHHNGEITAEEKLLCDSLICELITTVAVNYDRFLSHFKDQIFLFVGLGHTFFHLLDYLTRQSENWDFKNKQTKKKKWFRDPLGKLYITDLSTCNTL